VITAVTVGWAGICLVLAVASAHAQDVKLPTITINAQPEKRYSDAVPGPFGLYAVMNVSWRTTDADAVLLIGGDGTVQLLPPSGRLDDATSMNVTLVAIGKGGSSAVQFKGSARAIPQRRPQNYDGQEVVLERDVNPLTLFATAYKEEVARAVPLAVIRAASVAVLQEMAYSVDDTRQLAAATDGLLVYTKGFNANDKLAPPPGESPRASVRRQVALVLIVTTNQAGHPVFNAQPLVRKNFQRDSNEWKPDPDGSQIGLPVARDFVRAVVNRLP
jgi:hypothetical protein